MAELQVNKCPVCHQFFISNESPPCECWEYGTYGTWQGEGHYSKEQITYAIGYSGDLIGFTIEESHDSLVEVMKKEPSFLPPMSTSAYILKITGGTNKILYKWNNGWEEYIAPSPVYKSFMFNETT